MSTRVFIIADGRNTCLPIPLLTNPTHIGSITVLDPWSMGADVDDVLKRQLQDVGGGRDEVRVDPRVSARRASCRDVCRSADETPG